ncbi:MAG: hypothetical protein A2939_03300 [Parcubacteria group bacterium RIFCSPLOWO2_01_FULL_48_18]|nr:MAG: hypothetical protein A3J67_02290 [Parcubacteria group bacterium RIFCSPHIGHO2_02_FULL_48_10b]OHB23416.1 MAG: hypothetical protein A2939_03300 [Parcubacteria group bacterium RIFCSPLOWO2_01_FULL_48_18]
MATAIDIQKYLTADLFKEIHLDALTPEQRVSFLESFGNVVQQRVTLRLMEEMPDEQKDRLEAFLGARPDDPGALAQFLISEVPNLQDVVNEEVAAYKKQLMDRFNA